MSADAILNYTFCPYCSHPWGYHQETDRGCTMPVKPGTKIPVLNRPKEPSQGCGCSLYGKWVMKDTEGHVLRADIIVTELLSDPRCQDGEVSVTYLPVPGTSINEKPVSDNELFERAEQKFTGIGQTLLERNTLVRGYVQGMRDAIKRLEYHGMSDYEIRNALGMIKHD